MTLKENPMTARLTNTSASDFTLTDIQGRTVHLSDYRGKAHVVLVFNRGVL
jgi:peroxiredoxin